MKKSTVLSLIQSLAERNIDSIISALNCIKKELKNKYDISLVEKAITGFSGTNSGFLTKVNLDIRLEDLILSDDIIDAIYVIIKSYKQNDLLKKYNLKPINKLLFKGPPGSGKTSTAIVIGNELELPVYKLSLPNIIESFLGNTLRNIKKLFGEISLIKGVVLLDDLDALFLSRLYTDDSGEMKRAVVVALSELENVNCPGILIGTTNHETLLDKALLRRFDVVLSFSISKDMDTFRKIFDKIVKKKNINLDHNDLESIYNIAYNNATNYGDFTNIVNIELIKKVLTKNLQ